MDWFRVLSEAWAVFIDPKFLLVCGLIILSDMIIIEVD